MSDPIVSTANQELYGDYYHEDELLLRKREMTAVQTLDHIKSVWSGNKVSRILDVGAGEGSLLQQLDGAKLADELYGVEISASGIEAIELKKIESLKAIRSFDGYHIPYEDKYFDIAVSIHVLEHVEHERLFLYELKRVAKKVIIEIPLEHTWSIQKAIEQCGPHGHINFYTIDTIKNLLETSGLRCLELKVFPVGEETEIFISGRLKGKIKHQLRSNLLSISPKLATNLMTYMCTVYCEPI